MSLLIRSQDLAENQPGPTPPVAPILTKGTYRTLSSMLDRGTAVKLEPCGLTNLTPCHF